MTELLHVNFGVPAHGWLPVDVVCGDFHFGFDVSNVLNDPVGELCDTLLNLKEGEGGEVTWWLEPGAYFFNFGKTESVYNLNIFLTYDLHPGGGEIKRELEKTITGTFNEVIDPFITALREFSLRSFSKEDWSFTVSEQKLRKLLEDK